MYIPDGTGTGTGTRLDKRVRACVRCCFGSASFSSGVGWLEERAEWGFEGDFVCLLLSLLACFFACLLAGLSGLCGWLGRSLARLLACVEGKVVRKKEACVEA